MGFDSLQRSRPALEERMRHRMSITFLSLLVLLILVFSVNLQAYQYTTLMHDDFYDGSMENWMVILGEWEVSDAEMCQLQCGT